MNELEQTIKALHRSDRMLVITSHDMDESGGTKQAGTALVQGATHDIVEMIVSAMRKDKQMARYICAATLLYTATQYK